MQVEITILIGVIGCCLSVAQACINKGDVKMVEYMLHNNEAEV